MDSNLMYEYARRLGEEIKKDARMERVSRARKAYDEDPGLQAMIRDYEATNAALQQAAGKDTRQVEELQEKANRMYAQILVHPVYDEMQKAQESLEHLMNAVNATITYGMTGEYPSDCAHDCSKCGGCG